MRSCKLQHFMKSPLNSTMLKIVVVVVAAVVVVELN